MRSFNVRFGNRRRGVACESRPDAPATYNHFFQRKNRNGTIADSTIRPSASG
jgi:hypothetical protein